MAGIGLVREAVGMVRVGMPDVDIAGRIMATRAGGRRHAIAHMSTARIVAWPPGYSYWP